MMLSIFRMTSIISPTVSALSPHLLKPNPKLASLSLSLSLAASKSFFTTSTPLPFARLHRRLCLPKHSLQARAVHIKGSPSPSGEIHVIVGPMFAGKTTSLLRRIESESSNGSLQVEPQQEFLRLDRTVRGLCYSGELTEAIGLLWSAGVQLLPGTYSLLLQECIFRNAYRKAKLVHSHMVVVGYLPNEYLKTKLIILYSKLGDIRTANFLFDKLLYKSLVSWNAMIAGHVQKGDEIEALNCYYGMRYSGLTPDHYTFASVLRACAALATLEHGKRAHGVLLKIQMKENVVVSSALVDMYFKCSSLSDGHKAFRTSPARNIVTWTSLISGYGHHGRVAEVLNSFHEMKVEGFRPNNVTFLAVLSACSHGGLIEQGWAYFHSMARDYGIQPRGQHYATMIDLLGRAGRLKEAYELVLHSPCREHPVIWGAFLGACKTYGDIDMLKVAARKYFELEPENSGKYVVLSNAFATFGMWDNVAEIRGVMRNGGLIKEPGYSRIEVKDETHYFHKWDKMHRQTEEIYQLIKEMVVILKDVDYFPDLSPEL